MTTIEPDHGLTGLGSESLDMIIRLANEMYRGGQPEIPPSGDPPVPQGGLRDSVWAVREAMGAKPGNSPQEAAYYFMPAFQGMNTAGGSYPKPGLDPYAVRRDFPILTRSVNGKPLVWLDNAATTQKPRCVMDALDRYYSQYNSNIHRGAHTLAQIATKAYEDARERVRSFLGAGSAEEIVFVRGTTEAINLVAESYGGTHIGKGDEIVLTMMEHHSNIVPWQKLKAKGAVIKVVPINDRGEVLLGDYERLLTRRTKLVSIAHVSNVLGTINPVKVMVEMAHHHGACVLVDGAQGVPHVPVDVRALDADFYAFSGHKIYGPAGIGVLYGKRAILEDMPPWQRGGGMIEDVTMEETAFAGVPQKFEAGTPSIADAVGMGAALDYVGRVGMNRIERHERELTAYAMEQLYQVPGLHIIGDAPDKMSVISFVLHGVAPERAARYLNQNGIAVRAGHHCAMPTLRRYGLESCVRASLGMYNTMDEVDWLAHTLREMVR